MRHAAALALPALACGGELDDRARYLAALDPARSLDEAARLCAGFEEDRDADACLLARLDNSTQPAFAHCDALRAPHSRAECWFLGAERVAAEDRWTALEACGRAGPFMDECLYHCWTRELQALALAQRDLATALEAASDPTDYWSQLETAGPGQRERVWDDFWYLWWSHHPPASLQACEGLAPAHAERCERGTRTAVERSVDQAFRDSAQASLLDRSCRSGQLPSHLPDAMPWEPELQGAAQVALDRLCAHGLDAPRPWNPVFQPRRPR